MDLEKSEDRSVAKAYEDMFSQSEKELFTLLNPQANYPFTFSRQELSLFYLSSRSYVHFADVETRCRVAAYAFCAGIPVIGNSTIANILPNDLAMEPTFYQVAGDDYVEPILKAISTQLETNQRECLQTLSETYSVDRLVQNLNFCLKPVREFVRSQVLGSNLDIRLGAAHSGVASSNSYEIRLREFLLGIMNSDVNSKLEKIQIKSLEPEIEIGCLINLKNSNRHEQQTISIRKERLKEIRITRRGNLRFIAYQILKMTNRIPFLGSRIRFIYIYIKSIFG